MKNSISFSILRPGGILTRLSLAFLLGACAHKNALTLDMNQVDPRPAVILVSGYYGSVLREITSHKLRFISAGQVLFGSYSLSLYNKELQTPRAYEVEAEGLLGAVPVVPGIYSADVYGDLFRRLQKDLGPQVQVLPFVYDWRQDLPEAAANLGELVNQLQAKGVSRIDIVAHSMGGLVATYYLAYGNQSPESARANWSGAAKIRKLVVMGTPFMGVFSVFRNMQRGAVLGGNHTMLPAEAVASFPASYQLLPLQNPHELTLDNKVERLPMAEIKTWETRRLGLLKKEDVSPEIRESRRNFLQAQLSRAQKFSDLIQLKGKSAAKPDDLQVLNVIGQGQQVGETAFYQADKNLFIFDTDSPKQSGLDERNFWSNGDGTVTMTSATLPEGLAKGAKVLLTPETHTRLWHDPAVMKEIENFLAP